MSKTRGKDKMRDSIRVAKCEVDSVGGDWKETVSRWFALMDLCRRAANLYYETWLVWHVQNQSALQLEQWFAARKALGVKEAGKCPVDCLSKELSNLIYHTITRRYPVIQATVVTLLMQDLRGTLSSGKAAKGSLPKWSSILLHNEKMPSFEGSFPIPFSKANGELVVEGDDKYVEFKLSRMPVEGKSTQICIGDKVKLRLKGRKCANERAQFDKIQSGEWPFKGSQLTYDKKKNKWFVSLCHQRPSHVAQVDGTLTAYLVPGRNVPFFIVVRGQRKQWLEGRGQHIIGMRERIWRLRAEKSSSYRYATNRKGHGRNGANKWRAKSTQVWRHFVHRINHNVSVHAAEWCVSHGVGTLVYMKPNSTCAQNRHVSGDYKNSTWEFFDLASKLAYKCQDRGIALKVVECGAASGEVPEKTPETLAVSELKRGKGRAAKTATVAVTSGAAGT